MRHPIAIIACVLLLAAFGLLSWGAVSTKSATCDEPVQNVANYLHVFHDDFRLDPEDPPLWAYWTMIPHHASELRPDLDDPDWRASMSQVERKSWFCARTLYRTPGVDGEAFIDRTRVMMLILGIALGALVIRWTWELAGAGAAVAAGVLYCLDPNLLAHAPLAKNDVALALLFFGLMFALWRCGRRGTAWNIAAVLLVCGAAPAVKFSALVFGPLVAVTAFARAMLPEPWPVLGRVLESRRSRSLAAGALVIAAALVSWVIIWASYGFRFEPTPTPGAHLNFDIQLTDASANKFFVKHGRYPTKEELALAPRPMIVRGIVFAQEHRLMPEAWLYGLLYTYRSALVRPAFLLGQLSDTGWWYYFPLAMLVKTPLATLAAFAAAGAALVAMLASPALRGGFRRHRWPAICIAIPIVIYGTSALRTNLNLGLRHVLPLYPFLFLVTAVVMARWLRGRAGRGRALLGVLVVGLMAETLPAFPDYIPFFNAAAGGKRGGFRLLSDSNLDWGQDLPLLADWRRRHPEPRLYLCYFGGADPVFYGIDYINLPSGYFLNTVAELPSGRAVVAVSATKLQGLYTRNAGPEGQELYRKLRAVEPREVLGGSIYLFDYPLQNPASR